ncbi:single-stranded DNA-binding protein [Mycoplasmopsis columboralis]|uniref:Single strand binding protein n=1 Tax=Mycoplasmopsis columboralis TaxID=171282 RepID=A0A449B5P4_9BACT|nr:single-stranded DNA-binding protein [Mycoplasmopsis columboralis]VEU75889.1 single strand binding protein [Mycoplasmopsis columboralis]
MNKTFLLGRISSPIFYAKTFNRIDHARFWMRVSDRGQRDDFIPIICWNKTAAFVRDFLTKNSLIYLEGQIVEAKYFADRQDNINVAFVVEATTIKAFSFREENSMRPIFINVDVVDPFLYQKFDFHLDNSTKETFKLPKKGEN